jgi:ketol-acid reductoisomerase
VVKVYYDADADLNNLAGETVAILGYGIQGRAQAHNMRDSGVMPIIGNRDDEFRQQAEADGFQTFDIADAVKQADVILMLIPDEVQADVYRAQIEAHLKPGSALVFAHGFAIRFGQITPPDTVDTLLVSPRMPGGYVRQFFLEGSGVPAFVDVHHDATGRGWQRALALGKAVGLTRPGMMGISFAEETELDLFAEHYIYPLVIGALELAYDVLLNKGFTPEAAVMELYGSRELGEVFVTAAKVGLHQMVKQNASPACQYGIYSYEPRLFDHSDRQQIENIIEEIRNGNFARELIDDQKAGHPRLKQMTTEARQRPIVEMEARVRELMKFKNW